MTSTSKTAFLVLLFTSIFSASCSTDTQSVANQRIKLFTMNCGDLEVSDMNLFSVEGKLDGQKASLINPCFLIRHPKGDLLWDVGYPESLAQRPEGDKGGAFHSRMKATLTSQLEQLDLKPSEIEFLALSHIHPDHAGNANLFSGSTFFASNAKREYMFSDQMRKNPEFFENFSELESSKTILFDESYDIFGDSSVVIRSMPGHTPGSSVLLVDLENAGKILLTGDLYAHDQARKLNTVPKFNTDKAATLRSRAAFEKLAEETKARVIVQHSKTAFHTLPKFPAFLD